MNNDFTQQQSLDGLQQSEKLSLQATLPPKDLPGYRIERLLGQGAFGQVWQGHDLNTGRPVAIKFYLHRSHANAPLLDREVAHLVNMSTGRHIVQILAVGWEAEPPYYVMELLENGSLEDLLRSRGTLSISETVSMFREIAEGLSYVHAKGVLHCDLKPANVMLDHGWRPRLADFGQGRLSDEQTPSLGTLFFMAPEQADLDAVPDVAWDVYALGAIAYTMLVGSPPYRSPEVVETLDTAASLPERLKRYRDTIKNQPPPKLHHRRRGADKALCQIIDNCLEVDPEKRFSNVQQVVEAIDLRHAARTRRPLYLLGIVGPILLLLLMLLFSARSIATATQNSLSSVSQRSLESNQFAARFVAQSLEREIEELFRMVESEARRDELRRRLIAVTTDNENTLKQLQDGSKDTSAITQLKASAAQQELERYLRVRLASVIDRGGRQDADTIFNSIFVNDQAGTNVGISFAPGEPVATSPVGGNFAYRSYFTGERADSDSKSDRSKFKPTRETHLSASFRSTSTGAWKVGVSAPIWSREDLPVSPLDEAPAEAKPLGVLVLTINLGDFEILASDHSPEDTTTTPSEELIRFSALVDGREGNQSGTLLQHPLIREMDRELMRSVAMPQIEFPILEQLKQEKGLLEYEDPASSFESGDAFAGLWIASIEQVKLPKRGSEDQTQKKSDLWVLVQERGSSVAAPIRLLGAKLQRESLIEFGSLLLVILTLWYFVFRLGQSTLGREAAADPGDPSSQSTIDSKL